MVPLACVPLGAVVAPCVVIGACGCTPVGTMPMACVPCLSSSKHYAGCVGNDSLDLIKLFGVIALVHEKVLVPHARASITSSIALSSKKG